MLHWIYQPMGLWAVPLLLLLTWSVAVCTAWLWLAAREQLRLHRLRQAVTNVSTAWRNLAAADSHGKWRVKAENITCTAGFERLLEVSRCGASSRPSGQRSRGRETIPYPRRLEAALDELVQPVPGAASLRRSLQTIPAIAPLIGLAGTIAGFYETFRTFAASGAEGGFAQIAGPCSLAMTTTLAALVPTLLCLIVAGKTPLDVARKQERTMLRKLARVIRASSRSEPRRRQAAAPERIVISHRGRIDQPHALVRSRVLTGKARANS